MHFFVENKIFIFVENKIFINGYVSFYFAKKKNHEALFYYDRFCFAPC